MLHVVLHDACERDSEMLLLCSTRKFSKNFELTKFKRKQTIYKINLKASIVHLKNNTFHEYVNCHSLTSRQRSTPFVHHVQATP